jgi:flagellar hook-associated protein 2
MAALQRIAMAGLVSVSGLVSGLKSDDIINKILEFERRPIEQFQANQDKLRGQLAAYQEANTRLLAVKEAAGDLAASSFFSNRTVTTGDADRVTATAEIGATPGDYVISIEALARAHQKLSQSYADVNSTTVGTGSFTITAAGETTAITVDSSNNTLSGLRDAINRANTNVRASIVQDGDSSYRLMVSSKETGTANALTVSSSLAGGTALTFTNLQAAQDATVKLGTGADAITVTRSTNLIGDLIPGVTLNLLTASPGTEVSVTVSQDKQKLEDGVQKLVDQYNAALDYLNAQFKFDSDTQKGGVLLGDAALRNIQNDLADVFTSVVEGVDDVSLANIGITTGADGKLSLDTATLKEKLDTDPDSVAQVFALTAKSTNAGVRFISAGSKTVLNGTAYAVNITQAASQARVTAGVAQTSNLLSDETLTINGVEVALTAGMTQSQVIATLNARSSATHVVASATGADGTGTGGYLTLRSTAYGGSASVSVISSLSNAGGGNDTSGAGNVTATEDSPGGEGGSGSGAAGTDVAGTINGEAATGAGQFLTGNAGNATTDRLKLRITASTTGALGTITLSNGIANKAERALDSITSVVDGAIHDEEESLDQRIQDLQDLIVAREERMQDREAQLRLKFQQLESAMQQFQTQSASLSSQLASLR